MIKESDIVKAINDKSLRREKQADKAYKAIYGYVYTNESCIPRNHDDIGSDITDFLSDAMHMCHHENTKFQYLLSKARHRYRIELSANIVKEILRDINEDVNIHV